MKQHLLAMKRALISLPPESVRSKRQDGVFDMTVLSSKELLLLGENSNDKECWKSATTTLNKEEPNLPLFGNDACKAWDTLKGLIVIPLCLSNRLDELLYHGGGGGGKTEGNSNSCGGKIVVAGTLLTGPPGSGKTALAHHCAAVAVSIVPSTRLLCVSCTSLIHKEVGGSERAIQSMFTAAKLAAPCILLLDGIENIAGVRGNDMTTEGTMDRMLSTLLTEMDGVETEEGGTINNDDDRGRVAVIGITHNPDWVDPAVRRPGRLEKCITLGLPDYDARVGIAQKHLRDMPLDFNDASFFEPKNKGDLAAYIAMQSTGWTAADLIAVCADAAMIGIRDMITKLTDEGLNDEEEGDDVNSKETEVGILLTATINTEPANTDAFHPNQLRQQYIIRPRDFVSALQLKKCGKLK
uniref:AAA+ ATPase domain-containing protein n=1 Tax=Proboscia inermis TaxID=420281 RepID=A0A6T8IJ09_9STRA